MRTVSVVMATYNGASFIAEQLQSLAAQDAPPLELIVSDDGSTDETMRIVEQFRSSAPFPVILRRNDQRLGYGENFLSAARLASGEYLAFCDQDDVWHPEKLRLAVNELDRTQADLFVHTATVIDRCGRRTRRLFTQRIAQRAVVEPLRLGPWAVFYGCSMVFSRTLLEVVDPSRRGGHTFEYEGLLSHDLWIYFLATSLGRVLLEPRPLIDYRQHQANTTPALGSGFAGLLRSLGVAADPRLPRSDIARHRAELMAELGRSDVGPTGHAAACAAAYWQRISHYETRRMEMYVTDGGLRRAGKALSLAREGGYRPFRAGGLGKRLLVKDLLVGLFRARQWRSAFRRPFRRPATS